MFAFGGQSVSAVEPEWGKPPPLPEIAQSRSAGDAGRVPEAVNLPARWELSGPVGSSQTQLSWELVEPSNEGSPQSIATGEQLISTRPTWEPVLPGEEFSEARLARELEDAKTKETLAETATQPEVARPWIVGIGGGARIGFGEPTYPMIYGRLGRRLNKDFAISLRPSYIFGNSDAQGKSNTEGAFQMPLTLDITPDGLFSPFIGLGVATNSDSNGDTEPMLSVGIDLNITANLTLAAAVNAIYQRDDAGNSDIEALTVLYFRF